ncbi:PilN domain-containing protein [Tissierella sp. Yu-01]|uniref:PilN domain-containing protein n=1 Tax=Tissierella sp. Yu-01 TaxID=3035694 RepID=UPI00240E1A8D|nr:PilN domain-containing protein [Tissierella sp. Yu-01]WFA09678.1 PilN domain-containing protein [Tissierella sp. Yu-01]
MQDLNFFEPYIEKREIKFNKIYFLYILLLSLFVAIIFIGIYNQIRISALQKSVEQRKEVAENPKTIERVNEIKELESKVNTFKTEVDKIIELDKVIESKDMIGEELLRSIKSKMPEALFLNSFSAYEREIQISGTARDTYSIAELAKGLELIEEIEDIFVSSITDTDNGYSFVINLTLKDESEDGKEVNQE